MTDGTKGVTGASGVTTPVYIYDQGKKEADRSLIVGKYGFYQAISIDGGQTYYFLPGSTETSLDNSLGDGLRYAIPGEDRFIEVDSQWHDGQRRAAQLNCYRWKSSYEYGEAIDPLRRVHSTRLTGLVKEVDVAIENVIVDPNYEVIDIMSAPDGVQYLFVNDRSNPSAFGEISAIFSRNPEGEVKFVHITKSQREDGNFFTVQSEAGEFRVDFRREHYSLDDATLTQVEDLKSATQAFGLLSVDSGQTKPDFSPLVECVCGETKK